jgi:hypothetical protein
LLEEPPRSELKLAYLRAVGAGVFAFFVLGNLILSKLTPIRPPTIGSLGAALGWMTFAAAVLAILRKNRYNAWMRRAFPIADATLLVAGLHRVAAEILDRSSRTPAQLCQGERVVVA